MTQQIELKQLLQPAPLAKRALIGWIIGFALISFFLITAGKPNPAWPHLYWLKPVIITPLVAASGGVFYHLMDYLRLQGGWKKVLGYILGILGFVIALWLGSVLGLNGTYWN